MLTIEASQVYLPSPLCEERKAAGSKQSQRPDSMETEQGELARQINKELAGAWKTKAAAKEVSVGGKKRHVAHGYELKEMGNNKLEMVMN